MRRSALRTCSTSSAGRGTGSSQRRPALPKMSEPGASTRLRWRMPWTRLRRAVRDLAAKRPGGLVRHPYLGDEVRSQQLGQNRGVDLVGLTLASAMALVFMGLDTTTRPAWARSRSAICQVFTVASSTTWSSGPSVWAKTRSSDGVAAIRSPGLTLLPGSLMATSAKCLWTSRPMLRMLASYWDTRGQHDTYASALSAQPGWSQGRPYTKADSRSIFKPACPSLVFPTCPCPDAGSVLRDEAGYGHSVFIPDTKLERETGFEPATPTLAR